jgi:hypothetical protein
VGSVTALGGDRGEWFFMSMDGLYLSSILQDTKGDVVLGDNFVGQESFGGFLWRDEKGRVLVQLGGPSYRIMEVLGLDTTRKAQQTVDVSATQIAEGEQIAQKQHHRGPVEPPKLSIARVQSLPSAAPAPQATGDLIAGAGTFTVQESGDPAQRFRASLAHDGTSLAVVFQVNDPSPWKNGEGRYTHAFIGGDSVDLQLDVPRRGPIRILVASISGEDTVIYWQKKAPRKENPTTYVVGNNNANAQSFDVVKRLTSAKVARQMSDGGYGLLVTIPLTELGIVPEAMPQLKGIVGVIFSDPSGKNRASRLYWHDKATGLVSDVSSEARLNPAAWGAIEIAP